MSVQCPGAEDDVAARRGAAGQRRLRADGEARARRPMSAATSLAFVGNATPAAEPTGHVRGVAQERLKDIGSGSM